MKRWIMANLDNSNTDRWCDMSILGEEYVGQWAHLHEYLEQKCPTNFHMNGEKINFMLVDIVMGRLFGISDIGDNSIR